MYNSNDNLYEQVLPYAHQLKSVRLTKWGQVKFSAYTKELVLSVDQQTFKKNLKTNDERYRYLFSVCKKRSVEENLPTFWPMVLEMGAQMGMPNEGPFYDNTYVPPFDVKVLVSTPKTSSKNIDPYQHNQDLVKRWGPQLQEEPIKKMTHEEEWEWTRINDPEKFDRWETNAKQFRAILGLNEDGTFQSGRSPEQAVKVLMNIFTP